MIHRLDPRTKLVLLVVYIVALFLAGGPGSYGLMLVLLLSCIRISRIPCKAFLRGMKPLVFILIFTGIFLAGYALIWLLIYCVEKAKANTLNKKLQESNALEE